MIAAGGAGSIERQGARAGLISRGIAGFVDAMAVLLLLIAGYLVVSAVLFMARPARFHFPAPGRYWSMVIAMLVVVGYLAMGWYLSGRTPGKQLTGLRVVTTSGGGLKLPIAWARAALYVLFPIGLLWSAFSSKNASVQDLVLRTSVVYDWRKQSVETRALDVTDAISKPSG